jgi:chromosome segregation ATPase
MSRFIAAVTVCVSALLVASAVVRAQPTEYKEVQHPQPGEVKYDDKWADVTDLFKRYKDAKKEFADVLEKKKAINEQLSSIQKTLAGIESEYQKACTPVRQQQSAASAKAAYCQQYLTLRPPAPPQNMVEPAYPNRAWYKDDNAYRNDVNSYQQRLDATRRENKNRQENYKKQLDQFNTNQKEAQRVLKESQDTVASCTKHLQELDATRQGQMKDPVAQKQKTTAEQTVENQKALSLVALTGKLFDAVMTCPDQQRYQRGIADYRKSLYTPDEVQAMLDKAKADLAATPTSTSRQADVDELKVLLDRAKTAAKL